MSAQRALILVVCLWAAAFAEEVPERKVRFRIFPSKVTLTVTSDHGFDTYQVRSGEPLLVRLPSKMVDLKLSAPGWADYHQQIHRESLSSGVWPPGGGEIRLQPTGPKAWLQTHGPIVGGFAALALLLVWKRRAPAQRVEVLLAPRPPGDSRIGSQMGNYRLVCLLGQGGMATVYRALPADSMDEEEAVAIKVLSAAEKNDRVRFRREFSLCADMHHRNIVKVVDWGEHDGELYLVLEFLRGETLKCHIREGMPLDEVFGLLEGIFEGVAYAHRKGVVHRDLKPENIMVTDKGVVKVMDFGLARSHAVTQVTMSGAVVGTPAYIAPEQILGAEPAPACDQYALGVLAYELFTGRLPFEERDLIPLLQRHLQALPPPPRQFRDNLPEAVEKAILRMLEKDPGRRFDSVETAWKRLRSGYQLPPK